MANFSLKNLKKDFQDIHGIFKSSQEIMGNMDRLPEAAFFKLGHSINCDLYQEIENLKARSMNHILTIVEMSEIIKEREELKIRNQLKLRYQLEVKKLNQKLKEIREYEKSQSKKTNQKRSKILFNFNLQPNIYDIDTNGKKSYRKQYTSEGSKKFFVFHERNDGSDYYFNFNFYLDICAQNHYKKRPKFLKIKASTGKSSTTNNGSCSPQPKSKCGKCDCFRHLFSRKYGKKGYSILKNEPSPSLSSLSM